MFAVDEATEMNYHANQRAIVERLFAQRGDLRPDVDVDRATDILWTINHPNTWQLLVVDQGWTTGAVRTMGGGDRLCATLGGGRVYRTCR
jgi:hypothetical protein